MSNAEYHAHFKAMQKLHGQQPPCDACLFSQECSNTDACTPYRIFTETGEVVKPPRKLPTGENSND